MALNRLVSIPPKKKKKKKKKATRKISKLLLRIEEAGLAEVQT